MQYTANLNLNKPGSSDQYNIQHFNDNFDTLDSHVHALEESAGSIELELTEKINEAEQFSSMQGVCPINKGGTGANSAQAALNNLHGSVQVTSDIPDTAEVTFINHTPADQQEGTPEIKDVQAATLSNFANKAFSLARGDTNVFSATKNGLVPKTGGGSDIRFLSSDGLWRTPDGSATVYEATTSSSWNIINDTILRIEDDCTSVIGDATQYGTKLTVINETASDQNISINLESGFDVVSVPAGQMQMYIWTGFWRVQSSGGGGGGVSNNAPIGTVVGYLGTVAPENWLILQGQTLSRADYSGLLKWANDNELVGTGKPFGPGDGTTTFVLPDYRECALVGAGENGTDTIAAHDVYDLGEFKDDQLQDHAHYLFSNLGGNLYVARGGDYYYNAGSPPVTVGRAGLVTRGKRKGVNFIIKAKNDVNRIIVPTVVNTIEKWADSRWLTYSFTAENRQTLRVKGGTRIDLKIADGASIETRTFEVEEPTDYDLADLITGAANYASERNGEKNGRVFNVFLAPYGEDDVKLVVSTRFDAPSDIDQSYSVNNTRWIGCFSTLCVAVPANTTAIVPVATGTANGSSYLIKQSYALDTDGFKEFYTKTISAVSAGSYYDVATVPHTLAGFAAGDILPESVWCLGFMPSARSLNMNNVLGMVYDRDTDVAVDIYLQSGTGQNTATVYNATHTVSRPQQNHQDDMRQVEKLLISDDEFSSAALGSNERTNIFGSADKTTVGGHVDTAERRMISFVGCEEMCGYLWQWTRDVSANGGSGWATYDGQASFGQLYGASYALLAGGDWSSGASCGSRCRHAGSARSAAGASIGGRGVSRVIHGA